MPETQKLDFIREIGFTHMRISGESDVCLSLSLSLSLSYFTDYCPHAMHALDVSLSTSHISNTPYLPTSLSPFSTSLPLTSPLLSTTLLSPLLSSPLLSSPLLSFQRASTHSCSLWDACPDSALYSTRREHSHALRQPPLSHISPTLSASVSVSVT